MSSGDVSARLGRAALIAGAAFASAAPSTYYFARVAFPARARAVSGTRVEDLLEADLSSMALIVVIAALVGSLRSERYGLGGLVGRSIARGDAGSRVRQVALLWLAGSIVGLGSYLVFGRRLADAVPGAYPSEAAWAVALMVKGALFDEVVARYGMMTIVAGVTRRPSHANVLQAIFFTAVGVKSMKFFGVEARLQPIVVAGLAVSFLLHLVAGRLYEKHGLVAAVAFHFGLEVDRLVHAFWAS